MFAEFDLFFLSVLTGPLLAIIIGCSWLKRPTFSPAPTSRPRCPA